MKSIPKKLMSTKLYNIFVKSPYYSLRAFYTIKMLLLSIGILFFHLRFYGDNPIALMLNGNYRISFGLIALSMTVLGVLNILFKKYMAGLAFALGNLMIFSMLSVDALSHGVWTIAAISYFMDMLANAWLYFKLRFDNINLNLKY